MAHYYKLVTGDRDPIMVEDMQQIHDGQIRLVVEDMNNCVNGPPQFVTYTSAPQHTEAGLFHQQTILANQLTGLPLDQRQNLYIIKTTNDLPVQQNTVATDVIHTNLSNEGIVNIVDERGIQYTIADPKLLSNNIHEVQPPQQQQQIQWVIPENNITYEVMKPATPTQKVATVKRATQTLTLQSPGQSSQLGVAGPSQKKPLRLYKGKSSPRGGATGAGGDAVETQAKKTPQQRPKICPKSAQMSQQSPQLQTTLSSSVLGRSFSGNSNLNDNSSMSNNNNGGNSLGVVYRAKSVGVPVANPLSPIAHRGRIFKSTEASGVPIPSTPIKNLPAIHTPAMNALSERIKQDQMKKVAKTVPTSIVGGTARPPLHALIPRQQHTGQRANTQNTQRTIAQLRHPSSPHTQQSTTIATPQKVIEMIKKHTPALCQRKNQREAPVTPASDSDERMEVDSGTSECGLEVGAINNVVGCSDAQGDEREKESASVAYLQKIIDNPQATVVQDQIAGHTVKMIVVLPNGTQRLITFDIPNEPCTVLDLLEQANITFDEETRVSLVTDRVLGINYIVEGSANMMNCQDSSPVDTIESNQAQENTDTLPDNLSPNFGASDENSNSSVTHNEEPKYIDGKVAVCPNCGISSLDFNRCARCKKRLPDNVKSMPMTPDSRAKETMISIDSFYKKSIEQNSLTKPDGAVANKVINKGGRRPAAKKRPVKEPVCLIISSDEEDDGHGKRRKADAMVNNALAGVLRSASNHGPDTIHAKEPVITNNSTSVSAERIGESEQGDTREDENMDDGTSELLNTALECRTVRIGSYKYVPREPIVVTQSGIRFAVPLLEDETSFVNLDVRLKDIVKVLIHFGKQMPVLFVYTTPLTGATIREVLGMQDSKGPYYDPAGKEHIHKRITLLPIKLNDESKIILKNLFTPNEVLIELTVKEANDILVLASPKDQSQNSSTQHSMARRQGQTAAVNSNGGEIQVMTVYPPPPAKGGIAINTEDYICLGVDQFLNDAIIDFYLKYLMLEILSEDDRNRTHVFSSYFYKRLTSPHAQAGETAATLTPAARRHARVQKWTKNVNIFEKDFIIVPINEHAHWFLAIICYPGLLRKDIPQSIPTATTETAVKTAKKNKKAKPVKLEAVTIGSTTITPVKTTITLDLMDEGSERDEAEGDDDEMEMDSDEDEEMETSEETSPPFSPLTPEMMERSMLKLPCILIFDSLAGASRSRVVATLRDYLSCEHVAKVGTERIFSKDTIKGSSPKVPQQSNFTDCGLYLLQYVESFFKDPIRNYTLPIKTLKNWFEEIVVTRKREELARLLVKLMNRTKGDRTIVLPIVQFPTQAGKLKPKPEAPPVEPKTPKQVETDGKKKLPPSLQQTLQTADDKTRLVALSTSSVVTTTENSNEKEVGMRTIYQIVSQSAVSPAESTTSETLFDVKPKSTSGTLSFLRNKRIPRLVARESECQETQAVAAGVTTTTTVTTGKKQ